MLPVAQIPTGISARDCLAWSSDGELAIASGEQVHILIPDREGSEPWKHIKFRVGTFKFDDWPWATQASFKDMSIGEEQARVTVTAIAWSPPGLAKHRRSVLAVLTSNLLLSLWAPAGDIKDPQSWERVMIVNWAFTPSKTSPNYNGRRPLRRIRSMAWAPTYPEHTDKVTPFSKRKWGIHLLAITDDDNGIYLLSVSSPAVKASMPWDVKTLLYKQIEPISKLNDRPSLLSLVLNGRHFIDQIEFGTWTSARGILVIYHSSGTAYHAMLVVSVGPPLHLRLTDATPNVACMATPNGQISSRLSHESQIDGQKELYSAQNALDGHVFARIWGAASFDNLVASCVSLHPSNSFEFVDPSDGSAIILFEDCKDSSGDQNRFSWQSSPKVDVFQTYQTVLDYVLDDSLLHSLDLSNIDFRIIYAAVCAAVLANDAQGQQRLQTAEELLYLVQSKAETNLQAELELVVSCRNGPQALHQDLVKMVRETSAKRGQQHSDSNSQGPPLLDSCSYCSSDCLKFIGFESMTKARCPQNHPFST